MEELTVNSVEEHDRRVCDTKAKIHSALVSLGYLPDATLKTVNGQYVGLYVLPSIGHLCVGFGDFGSKIAFRGPEKDFDVEKVVKVIVATLAPL